MSFSQTGVRRVASPPLLRSGTGTDPSDSLPLEVLSPLETVITLRSRSL